MKIAESPAFRRGEFVKENPAPVFMEFNAQWWNKSGFYEKMMKFLPTLYSKYIWIHEVIRTGKANLYPIEKLWEFQNSVADFGALGDIFLIKKN